MKKMITKCFFHLIHLFQRNPGSKKVIKFFIGYFGYTQRNLSYEEVIKMFVELTPLENTRSYKELVAIGEKKKVEKNVKKKVKYR